MEKKIIHLQNFNEQVGRPVNYKEKKNCRHLNQLEFFWWHHLYETYNRITMIMQKNRFFFQLLHSESKSPQKIPEIVNQKEEEEEEEKKLPGI